MKKLKLQSRGQYRNANRKIVFRYAVSGTPDAIKAYEDAQGEYYREDDTTGEPLWFTTSFVGKTGILVVTEDGKIYADTSELEQQASLVAQLGGNLGVAMAAEIARQMTQTASAPVATQPASKVTPNASGLSGL